MLGWPARAPYDRVLVSAAAATVPPALLEQLAVGGVLVVPVDGVMTRVVLSPEGPVVERARALPVRAAHRGLSATGAAVLLLP